jgi:hypothetical protein
MQVEGVGAYYPFPFPSPCAPTDSRTGYGFTKEPDWLFVLDRRTGKTIQKLPLPKAPEALRATESRLFVRLYDGYAVFAIFP